MPAHRLEVNQAPLRRREGLPAPRSTGFLAGAALVLCCGLAGSACERAEEKIGRMGETASRQVGRSVTENMNRADNALDEPFERVQEAADEKMTDLGDSVDDTARGAIDGGLEGAERAARNAASSVRFDSGDASDEFDSPWADKPEAAE
jgi:hypothetical protein